MYSLGFIKYHYPRIHVIGVCDGEDNRHDQSYEWLRNTIDAALLNSKIVLVMLYDEDVLAYSDRPFLANVLNTFTNDTVYFVTQMDSNTTYIEDHNIQCKILELPWIPLNDCMCYDALNIPYESTSTNDYSYISLMGVPHPHRIDLVSKLSTNNLASNGLITVMTPTEYHQLPASLQHICKINPNPPYKEPKCNGFPDDFPNERGCYSEGGLLVSGNVKNFIQLQKDYNDIPLTIHAETSLDAFFNTEKSIWPVLLGKLFLVYGRPGTMAWIQRFYEINMSDYVDLAFDCATKDRLDHMLNDNREFILNSRSIHQQLGEQIREARYKLGENLYNFFTSQLDKIYNT